jgi:hypothetical protein
MIFPLIAMPFKKKIYLHHISSCKTPTMQDTHQVMIQEVCLKRGMPPFYATSKFHSFKDIAISLLTEETYHFDLR